MECMLCHGTKYERVQGKVRDIPGLGILRCNCCGLVFLENHDHINDSFYERSKMRVENSSSNWEAGLKLSEKDDERRKELLTPTLKGRSLLDFGCGGGGVLIKVRDVCSRCSGLEIDKNYVDILRYKLGFEIFTDIEQIDGKYDVITMFHVMEHLPDPKATITKILQYLKPSGSLIVEVPNAGDALLTLYGSKAFSEFTFWGPHLYLFNGSTIRRLFEDLGLSVNYIKQIQRYPLSNHLYWLAKGQPGGHQKWGFMDSPELDRLYEARLGSIGACDTIIASVSIKNSEKNNMKGVN